MTAFLKLPTQLLNRNFHKILTSRSYSGKRSNQKTSDESALKRVNIYGAFGIGSALLASYFLVKHAYNRESDGSKILDLSTTALKTNLVPVTPDKNIPIKENASKEEKLREQYNFIKKVVNECAGAVFYLELRDPYQTDPETGDALITSNGSGFVISEDGWALTNAHVVLNKPQSTITAIMRDGKSYKARVEDADMNIDLALLKLDAHEKLPSLQFGEPGDTAVGEWVVALGSPLSLSNSVTVGIISSIDRPAEELGLKNYSMTYIQTDASITFGNSGGPLVNLDGNVIGVNNLRLTSGISFAIPVEYAKRFLENSKYRTQNLVNKPARTKTLFGLTTISITPDLLVELTKTNNAIPTDVTQGLLVWKIIPGTPADESGMEVGDIITHVNGIPIEKPAQLYNSSSSKDPLEIDLINKGKKKTIKLNMKPA